MDGKKFDCLVRGAAGESSRRRLLGTFGVGLGTAALAAFGLAEDTSAKCIKLRRQCRNNDKCCGDGRFTCDRVSQECNNDNVEDRGQICCGRNRASCKKDCDCCRDFFCNKDTERCERI